MALASFGTDASSAQERRPSSWNFSLSSKMTDILMSACSRFASLLPPDGVVSVTEDGPGVEEREGLGTAVPSRPSCSKSGLFYDTDYGLTFCLVLVFNRLEFWHLFWRKSQSCYQTSFCPTRYCTHFNCSQSCTIDSK